MNGVLVGKCLCISSFRCICDSECRIRSESLPSIRQSKGKDLPWQFLAGFLVHLVLLIKRTQLLGYWSTSREIFPRWLCILIPSLLNGTTWISSQGYLPRVWGSSPMNQIVRVVALHSLCSRRTKELLSVVETFQLLKSSTTCGCGEDTSWSLARDHSIPSPPCVFELVDVGLFTILTLSLGRLKIPTLSWMIMLNSIQIL